MRWIVRRLRPDATASSSWDQAFRFLASSTRSALIFIDSPRPRWFTTPPSGTRRESATATGRTWPGDDTTVIRQLGYCSGMSRDPSRSLTGEVLRVVRAAGPLVGRHLRHRADRPGHVDARPDRPGRDHDLRLDPLLPPALEGAHEVHLVGALAAAAVRHPGHHEQPD